MIKEKVECLRRRGVKDERILGGLQFLAIEELYAEKEVAYGKIKEKDWLKAKSGNCFVACIPDLQRMIQTDKIFRKIVGKPIGRYGGDKSFAEDCDVLNQVYDRKRRVILSEGNTEEEAYFQLVDAYWVDADIDAITRFSKDTEHYIIVYTHTPDLGLNHALKFLDVDENGYVIGQDLDDNNEISLIKRRPADLLLEDENRICVIRDDKGGIQKLSEEEKKSIHIAPLTPDALYKFYQMAGPVSAAAWIAKGNACFSVKRFEEALVAYDKATELKPDDAHSWFNKGCASDELNRYEEAINAYDKATALKPDYADSWINKGSALIKIKRYEEAINAYDKGLELNPDDAGVWCVKGFAFSYLERYEDALRAFDKALELKPDDANVLNIKKELISLIK